MSLKFPNIDPVVYTISIGDFDFSIRWYALSYIAGILIAWRLMLFFTKKRTLWGSAYQTINSSLIENFMTYIILGIILGGRLGYVCFYQPVYFLNHPLEIFQIWTGGMSFHGGFLGVMLATLLFSWKNSIPILTVGDIVAVSTPPGIFLGRIANFINGELWGKPTTSSLGIVFPSAEAQKCPIDWRTECARHPSQLYEAVSEGLILWLFMLIIVFYLKGFKRPGLMIGTFLSGYGISRLIVEIFREADRQFVSPENPYGYIIFVSQNIGISMGQLLSVPMIITGAIFVAVALKTINSKDNV